MCWPDDFTFIGFSTQVSSEGFCGRYFVSRLALPGCCHSPNPSFLGIWFSTSAPATSQIPAFSTSQPFIRIFQSNWYHYHHHHHHHHRRRRRYWETQEQKTSRAARKKSAKDANVARSFQDVKLPSTQRNTGRQLKRNAIGAPKAIRSRHWQHGGKLGDKNATTKFPVCLLQLFGVFAGIIRLVGHCAVFRADMLGVNFGISSFSHSVKSFKLFNDVKGSFWPRLGAICIWIHVVPACKTRHDTYLIPFSVILAHFEVWTMWSLAPAELNSSRTWVLTLSSKPPPGRSLWIPCRFRSGSWQ